MPFALQLHDDLASAVRDLARTEADDALVALDAAIAHDVDDMDLTAEDVWDEGVHDLRTTCKKVRAIARLCRAPLGDHRRRVNAAFRDTARIVSEVRDAWAVIEALDALVAADPDVLPAPVAEDLRAALVDRYRRVRTAPETAHRLRQARAAMADAAAGIDHWPLPHRMRPRDLQPGITRVYGQACAGWTAVQQTIGADPQATAELWHDWRKRVKYLWYVVRLVEPAWPPVLGALGDVLDDVADTVGRDHDLDVLLTLVDGMGIGSDHDRAVAREAATQRRHDLRAQVGGVAPLLFVEAPGDVGARLAAYVRIARTPR